MVWYDVPVWCFNIFYYYLHYQKVEDWEAEKTEADMEKYFWDIMASRKSLLAMIKRQRDFATKVSLVLLEFLPPTIIMS